MTDETQEILEKYCTYETLVAIGNLAPDKIPEDGICIELRISQEGELWEVNLTGDFERVYRG